MNTISNSFFREYFLEDEQTLFFLFELFSSDEISFALKNCSQTATLGHFKLK